MIGSALRKERTALRKRLSADCEFLVTGLGAKRTYKTLERRFQSSLPQFLIYTGTAGQLDPSLEMGEIIVPEEWSFEDGPSFAVDPVWAERLRAKGWKIAGRGLTVRMPVVRAKSRRELHQKYGARVCDMEAAVALEVAARHRIPCIAVKAVSDTAASGLLGYWKQFDETMDRLARYLDDFLRCL